MKGMKNFYHVYDGASLCDDGAYLSSDARRFFLDMRDVLKLALKEKNIELISFNIGHYDCFFFCKANDKFVYGSYSVQRGGLPLDLDSKSCYNGFLYRTAENLKDYRGGTNHFTSWLCLIDEIEELLNV